MTQNRIPGVKIVSFSPKVQRLSDQEGRFRLEDFSNCDSLYFLYPGYSTAIFSLNDLKKMRWVELKDEHLTIDEMVVTANRWEQYRSKVPLQINTINLKELELMNPQTTADLLQSGASVFVQKSQQAGGSPQLRGFATNRVLLVVDGVRMNNAIFRAGNLQNVISIDPNSLESVEVLYGPGGVRYGSDAIGGVMDFTSKENRFATSDKRWVKAHFFSRYSSASNEYTGHVDLQLASKKWASTSAFSYSRFGDLRAGSLGDSDLLRPTYQSGAIDSQLTVINPDPTKQVHSAYMQYNILQKISFLASPFLRIDYGFIYAHATDAPRYDRLIQDANKDGELDYHDWYYGPQRWMMNYLKLTGTQKSLLHDQWQITLAHQRFHESRHDLKSGSTSFRRQFEMLDALSMNLDADKRLSSRARMFYGTEFVFNLVHSTAYLESSEGIKTPINSRYPDQSKWQTFGLYANFQYDLTKNLVLNSGIRYTLYQLAMDFDTTLFPYPVASSSVMNSALNGSIGLILSPTKTTSVYTNLSTGFRAPNIDDMAKIFDSQPGNVVIPNDQLRPEYAYNAEIGIHKALLNRLKLDASVYGIWLDDAISIGKSSLNGVDSILYQGEWSAVYTMKNSTHAYVYGIQGGIDWVFLKDFSFQSNLSWQKGEEYNSDSSRYYPKPQVPPLFGRSGVKYKTKHLSLWLYGEYSKGLLTNELPLIEREKEIYALNKEGEKYVPAWFTINFKAAIYFNKHLSVHVGVENISDQLYRTSGSGISAPGRNWIFSVKVTP